MFFFFIPPSPLSSSSSLLIINFLFIFLSLHSFILHPPSSIFIPSSFLPSSFSSRDGYFISFLIIPVFKVFSFIVFPRFSLCLFRSVLEISLTLHVLSLYFHHVLKVLSVITLPQSSLCSCFRENDTQRKENKKEGKSRKRGTADERKGNGQGAQGRPNPSDHPHILKRQF